MCDLCYKSHIIQQKKQNYYTFCNFVIFSDICIIKQGVDEVIGCFVTPLCVLVSVPQDKTFISHIRAVKSSLVDAIANSKWPMEFLSKDVLPNLVDQKEWSSDMVFQSLFAFAPEGGWLEGATNELDLFGPDVVAQPGKYIYIYIYILYINAKITNDPKIDLK